MNEKLLDAWIDVSNAIRGERIVSSLTYNESVVCNLLVKSMRCEGGLTASQLCRETRMQKSQMNRTLKSLEDRGLICRTPFEGDRRKSLITIDPDHAVEFSLQHDAILSVVARIADELGDDRTQEVIDALKDLSIAARKVLA